MLLGCCLLITSPTHFGSVANAWADAPSQDEARSLFQQARALVMAEDYASALEKLERVAAYKRTPQVVYYIGLCHEKLGKLVMALGEYRIAVDDARAAKADDVVAEATAAIARIEPRIPRVTIVRGENASAAAITVDGKVLGDAVVGTPMPLDPGTHVIVAGATGHQPFRQEVTLVEGDTIRVEVVMEAFSGAGKDSKEDTSSTNDSASDGPTRWPAWVAFSVGVAGFGTAGVFAATRHKALSDLESACPSKTSCDRSNRNTYLRGKRDSMMVNIGLGVGAAGLITGATWLLLTNGSPEPKPVAQPPQPGLSIRPAPPPGGWAGVNIDGTF